MRRRFFQLGVTAAMAVAVSFAGSERTVAAEPAVSVDAYSPLLMQPANSYSIRIAQTNPPPPGTPAQSAQPGQSTIPPATSTPPGATPAQGAQPGQSTIPPATSTPSGTTPAAGAGQAPAGVAQPPAAIGVPVTPVIPPPQVVPQQQVAPQAPAAVPPAAPQPDAAPAAVPPAPLLDGGEFVEELPLDEEEEEAYTGPGVRPYGGGHPKDWSWGCGGSPYRTNGRCDNWKVGCDWHITVDGMVMSREEADLEALNAAVMQNGLTVLDDPALENFDYGPGGRITATSQVPHFVGYQVQAAYEGIEAWNSFIVYEKQPLPDIDLPLPPEYPPPFDPFPPEPFPEGTEQRRIHYRSNLHSGELNFLLHGRRQWRHYCGVRFIKFDDEINDFLDQQAQPPLAGPRDPAEVIVGDPPNEEIVDVIFPPIGPVVTTDRLNLFDVENNLMGFQIGLINDTWKVNRRFSIEAFVNSGVYYNKIKYTNLMGIFTTQEFADNVSSTDFDESRVDFSDTINNDVRELSEISYHAEASLTGVCRLNKCWALRAGYQGLWIANVHLAEDAYLTGETEARDLFFHGWHAGIECRR